MISPSKLQFWFILAVAILAGAPNTPLLLAVTAPAQAPERFFIREYRVAGTRNLAPVDVESSVSRFLGPGRTVRDMELARAALEKAYADAGHPTISVILPPQDVVGGIVELRVTERAIDQPSVKGAKDSARKLRPSTPALPDSRAVSPGDVSVKTAALNPSSDRQAAPSPRPDTAADRVDGEDALKEAATPVSVAANNPQGPSATPSPSVFPISANITDVALPGPRPGAQSAPDPLPPARTAPAEGNVGPIILRDESIDQVLALLERWTGKTILRPQALPTTTITLTLKGSVTREEAVRALETLLALNGVAVTPLDDQFIKVTALANAKSEAPELIDGTSLGRPASGRVVSKVFQLNFLRAPELVPQITPLLNPGSTPVTFEKANAVLITDSLSNIQRVEVLLNQLDQPRLAGLEPRFYNLHFAKASDVVTKMHTILSGSLEAQIGTSTSYNPDDRTNQIILIADPRQHPFFDDLIAKLDVKSDPNTRNEVLYLKHAAAKDVASILSQLVSGQNAAAKTAGGENVRPVATTNNKPAANTPAPAAPPIVPVATVTAALGLGAETSNQFSSLLTILPEERSNSIVVSGTVDDIRLIGDLVAKLDVLLAQVRIEVVIAEVTLGNNATSGISELGLTVQSDKLVGFSGKSAGFNIANGTVTYPGIVGSNGFDLAGVITLSTTPRKTNATILSQPTIITTHNKEGKIFVGESRPVISSYLNDSSSVGNTGLGGYRSTVSSQDIGIDLSVKPLIGNDGSVQLEIKQQVNDILGEITIDGNPQPRIGKRTTESFISVKSGEIIVLGGLQRSSKSKSTSRLGPIPIIGDLFGSRKNEDTRTDLIFFLRPTILTNTSVDNAAALQQIESFPEKQREQVTRAIAPPAAAKP